jgi:cytochrome c553
MKLPALSLALSLAAAAASMHGTLSAAEAKAGDAADPAKGQTIAATCQACHTADGTRGLPVNPILQGQHADYIVKQLGEFQSGKRNNPVMKAMAAPLSADDMKHVAAFYAGKKAKTGFAKSKDTIYLGEKIYRGGITERQVPACSGCHSPDGAGIPAQYPRVAGQHAEYTEAQLVAFRAGQRTNSAQMSAIATRLNDREIKAVADYISGLR